MIDRLTFLGHPTVLVDIDIDIDGVRVLTDPPPGHVAAGVIRRHVPAVLPALLERLSAVFIRHRLLDHMDLAPLRAFPGRPAFIVPVGLGRAVAKVAHGVGPELRAGDRPQVGDLHVEAGRAEHGRRRPDGPGEAFREAVTARTPHVDARILQPEQWMLQDGRGGR